MTQLGCARWAWPPESARGTSSQTHLSAAASTLSTLAQAQSSKERGVPGDWLTGGVSSRLLSCGTSGPSTGAGDESIVFYSEC